MASGGRRPLIEHMQAPTPRGRRTIWIVLGSVAGLLAGGYIVMTVGSKPRLVRPDLVDRPPSEQVVVGDPSTSPDALRYPSSYLQEQPKAPPPQAATVPTPPPPGPPPPGAPRMQPPPPPAPPPWVTPPQLHSPGQPRGAPGPGGPPAAGTTPGPPHDGKKRHKRWLSAENQRASADLLKPPADDSKDQDKQPSKLFPKAVWEKPADPYKILYWDQIINGQLVQDIQSDTPGLFRIKATEDTMDRWGHGHTIIPVDTTFLGRQEGNAQFGQSVIPANITAAIFPDGSAIQWNKGQAGSAMGAAGIPANVNNHWLQLFVGVGIQALLNVGTRAPFGSVQGFQQNLPQEFAQDAAQGINRQAERAVQQKFILPPTLSQHTGYPVTIQFGENVSFQTPAPVISK